MPTCGEAGSALPPRWSLGVRVCSPVLLGLLGLLDSSPCYVAV